ncbi:lysozyme [Altererythrobacter aurantiacus]|uniref:Lysozyme n=1 Tax=Parapontixanthobacter aurantiacus TaxID=1463599 RepID=A0A844ZG69_9SPHN|nr:glycoside hydrolase family 25 protein [Parapontixanthobacter aurantiacus]MXO86363.1 lysozyme [Parapontixanthobacter aurantiacus]
MVRTGSSAAASRRSRQWLVRLILIAVLAGLIAAGLAWWRGLSWKPDAATYPRAGIYVSEASGEVNFRTARALGAQFAYLQGSLGADGLDGTFAANIDQVRASGMKVGVVHAFDPCVPADLQSAKFVTVVPRDPNLLPPAIALEKLASQCPQRVSEAAVESELMTLVNQIEIHAGKPVILKPSRAFEREYEISSRIERNLWLASNWYEPSYAGRPWLLWTANDALHTEAAEEPIAWVVVQP